MIQVNNMYTSYWLDNGGDTIVLVDPSGREVNRFAYDGSSVGVSWQRCGDVPTGEIKAHNTCASGNNQSPGQMQDMASFTP